MFFIVIFLPILRAVKSQFRLYTTTNNKKKNILVLVKRIHRNSTAKLAAQQPTSHRKRTVEKTKNCEKENIWFGRLWVETKNEGTTQEQFPHFFILFLVLLSLQLTSIPLTLTSFFTLPSHLTLSLGIYYDSNFSFHKIFFLFLFFYSIFFYIFSFSFLFSTLIFLLCAKR